MCEPTHQDGYRIQIFHRGPKLEKKNILNSFPIKSDKSSKISVFVCIQHYTVSILYFEVVY